MVLPGHGCGPCCGEVSGVRYLVCSVGEDGDQRGEAVPPAGVFIDWSSAEWAAVLGVAFAVVGVVGAEPVEAAHQAFHGQASSGQGPVISHQ